MHTNACICGTVGKTVKGGARQRKQGRRSRADRSDSRAWTANMRGAYVQDRLPTIQLVNGERLVQAGQHAFRAPRGRFLPPALQGRRASVLQANRLGLRPCPACRRVP
eukprot:6202821-Pleurochrysis_carterae.AAC.1